MIRYCVDSFTIVKALRPVPLIRITTRERVTEEKREKWVPKSIMGRSAGVLSGRSWAVLGIIGPKSLKMSATLDLQHPFGPQIGGENQSKIHPEAIEKVIVFLITFGIDF